VERRFGPLSDAGRRRLAAIGDLTALESLVKRALAARSLADLGLDGDG